MTSNPTTQRQPGARRITHWLRRLGRVGNRPGLLTVTDPQSGRTAKASVRLFEYGGERWLVAPYGKAPWVCYARAAGEVTIRRGRVKEVYHVEELSADAAAPILKQYVMSARRPYVYLHARADQPLEEFVPEVSRCPVFRLTRKAV